MRHSWWYGVVLVDGRGLVGCCSFRCVGLVVDEMLFGCVHG